jgi:hypothetical protein
MGHDSPRRAHNGERSHLRESDTAERRAHVLNVETGDVVVQIADAIVPREYENVEGYA